MKDLQQKVNEYIVRSKKVKFEHLSYDKFQPWDVVFNWQFGETKDINGTKNTKTFHSLDKVVFRTTIPPGTSFPDAHYHNCKEVIKVVKGIYTDLISYTSIKPGDQISYDKMEPHHPANTHSEDCEIIVEFYRTL